MSAPRCGITPSSRCSATSRSATISSSEAVPFAWELLTKVWELPPDRLYPTIFKGEAGIPRDDEAHGIWTRLVPAERITELGLAENFWSMGDTGPCGRCSEIHYFRGAHLPCDEERAGGRAAASIAAATASSRSGTTCSWNSTGRRTARSIRCPRRRSTPAWASSESPRSSRGSSRTTTLICSRRSSPQSANVPGMSYGSTLDDPSDVSMRVIADHLRAMTFLIADGVVPSNEWRGYVLRKIMRRAMRHGKKLGFREPVLHALVDVVVAEMGAAYPELPAQSRRCRTRRAQRRGTVRRGADGRAAATRGGARPRGRSRHADVRRRGVPAVRLARCAPRLHGGSRRPAQHSRSIARDTSAPWRASGSRRARAATSARRQTSRWPSR